MKTAQTVALLCALLVATALTGCSTTTNIWGEEKPPRPQPATPQAEFDANPTQNIAEASWALLQAAALGFGHAIH